MRDSKNSLITRTLFGALFAAANIGAMLCGKSGFVVLLLSILLGCTYEFNRITRLRNYHPRNIIGLISALSIFACCADSSLFGGVNTHIYQLIFILTIPTIFISELFSGSKTPVENLGATKLSLMYIAIPTALLSNVAMMLGGGEFQPLLMIAYIMIIWANDSFAYLFGVFFGRNVMFARISPKKSWEGLIGGITGALLFGIVAALVLDQNWIVWGGIAVIAATTGVLGDLVESMFKRAVNIKDSGNMLPGHGGWLDRFDALLISTPVIYVYLYSLNFFNVI